MRSNSWSWFCPGAKFVNCFCDLITLASAFTTEIEQHNVRTVSGLTTVLGNFTFYYRCHMNKSSSSYCFHCYGRATTVLCPSSSSYCHVFCFCDSGGFLLDYQDYENSHKKMRVERRWSNSPALYLNNDKRELFKILKTLHFNLFLCKLWQIFDGLLLESYDKSFYHVVW